MSSRPYRISKTLGEFLVTEGKCWSYRMVKLLFPPPYAGGGFYPSSWSVLPGRGSHGFPFRVGTPTGRSGISLDDQGSRGVAIVGIPDLRPSRSTLVCPQRVPSHQIVLGGCPLVGNTSPAVRSPGPSTRPAHPAPPLPVPPWESSPVPPFLLYDYIRTVPDQYKIERPKKVGIKIQKWHGRVA